VCTWPHGQRPDVPTRYADEVWTGTEHAVAALCLWQGLATEGRAILDAVWARYDGRRRNPYNEIECGDHYVRSLSGWSVFEALAGFAHDANTGSFTFNRPAAAAAAPFLASTGWGLFSLRGKHFVLECAGGSLEVGELIIIEPDGEQTRFEFPDRVRLTAGETTRMAAR
jgi:hypothetical protein